MMKAALQCAWFCSLHVGFNPRQLFRYYSRAAMSEGSSSSDFDAPADVRRPVERKLKSERDPNWAANARAAFAGAKREEERETLLAREKDEDETRNNRFDAFTLILLVLQVIFVVLFSVLFRYPTENIDLAYSYELYPYYRDVCLMVLVGFGYLMSFLRRHRFGSLTYTMLITLICMQWGILVNTFFIQFIYHGHHYPIPVDVGTLLNGLFTAAAVLISFGAWIGKVNGEQLLVITLFEVVFQVANNYVCVSVLHVHDLGGTIVIHMFGAYFGLAATMFLSPKNTGDRAEFASSSYDSDTFSLLATFFLWIFWPSFNAAVVPGIEGRTWALLNTVISLVGSGFTALAASRLLRMSRLWTLEDIENSTLAGGVAIGASASMIGNPGAALGLGVVVGFVSVMGYAIIGPFLQEKIGLYDTAGIHNLHGMPSFLGAIASLFVVGSYYGWADNYDKVLMQLAGIGITMTVSIISGAIVGLVVSYIPTAVLPKPGKLFQDDENFEVAVLCNHLEADEAESTGAYCRKSLANLNAVYLRKGSYTHIQ